MPSKIEQSLSIVGSSRPNGDRDLFDYYPTPSAVTSELLKKETFSGSVWEPACGDGAISKVLKDAGLFVESSDIADRGYGETGIDFLRTEKRVGNIVTNPPFNLALEFVNHAKKCSVGKIAMFLKTTFLESEKRYSMFKDASFPLKKMYQFSKRVRLDKNGIPMVGKSGMIAFAWFVWDKEHSGPATIDWII
jgi:hypothetical protein